MPAEMEAILNRYLHDILVKHQKVELTFILKAILKLPISILIIIQQPGLVYINSVQCTHYGSSIFYYKHLHSSIQQCFGKQNLCAPTYISIISPMSHVDSTMWHCDPLGTFHDRGVPCRRKPNHPIQRPEVTDSLSSPQPILGTTKFGAICHRNHECDKVPPYTGRGKDVKVFGHSRESDIFRQKVII